MRVIIVAIYLEWEMVHLIILKFKTIEALLPKIKQLPEDYETKYKESRRLFTMYHDTLDLQQLTIRHSERKLDELFEFLTKTCSMSEKRVQNSIKKLSKGINE